MAETKPYTDLEGSKKSQVRQMFNRIAPVYDFLNGVLSLGIDRSWRKKAIAELADVPAGEEVLDVATGTAVLAIQAYKKYPTLKFRGMDLSEGMLELGRKRLHKLGLTDKIQLDLGDSENLPYDTGRFSAVMAAFGVRNFEDLDKGLAEMYRVTKPGGKIIVLEFSKPKSFPFKHLFKLYFKYLLPNFGKLVSKDPRAYQYLYESVQQFPDYERFLERLSQRGFVRCAHRSLTLGICCIYTGIKP
ncbi:MAG: bifunctional demethylmenaquinone methyltransferase/2-methoxy-6-polyprenyl-1,4-benzoquinol methylase UbiE [Saprospiraceae bacterium]|nr:bifunctional demethylmenaquinone methyltransferase/2-methoxy-6-polyprenyl-1,4-benzoquinol methylase UbiE [Candidatus Vicinibacter affinis]